MLMLISTRLLESWDSELKMIFGGVNIVTVVVCLW